jgi:hypothetical protein
LFYLSGRRLGMCGRTEVLCKPSPALNPSGAHTLNKPVRIYRHKDNHKFVANCHSHNRPGNEQFNKQKRQKIDSRLPAYIACLAFPGDVLFPILQEPPCPCSIYIV